MYYRINVSLYGKHFFATGKSVDSLARLRSVYTEIKSRFPESEGWKVSVSEWTESGKELDMNEILRG